MVKRVNNILFFVIILGIICFGWLGALREEKDISQTENRSLQKFEHFILKDFFSGEYQAKLENALNDQFVMGETIKNKTNYILNLSSFKNINKKICQNKYVNLGSSYYSFNCAEALIWKYNEINESDEQNILARLNDYSELNKYIDTYYYFINTSTVFDFSNNTYSIDIVKMLNNNLTGNYHLSYLDFKNYDEYSKMFYKSDHHWNYIGSYTGYKDIMKMIYPNDSVLEIEDEIKFTDITFLGSSARISQIDYYEDEFNVYKFSYPDFEIINNRSTDSYGNEESYFNNNYSKDKFNNHYANFYGDDSGEVIFKTNNSKDNILILSNSFSNAINKLLASHFNETYVVDLRHYETTFNENFDITSYIEARNINKVLLIMDYSFLTNQSFNIELGGE